ncbi:MAG: hypothetical protein LBJ03_00950 [Holosporales bacterium]|nr:hypothetical protein [Holosporales bacterium]
MTLSANSSVLAPFGAKPDENIHTIATRIKAEKGGEMLEKMFIRNYGASVRTILDAEETASGGYFAFVVDKLANCAAALAVSRADVDHITEIVKYFFDNGYDKMATDPETGACPLQVLLTCAYMLKPGEEEIFSLVCHAFEDAFDPSTGGKCLQGYTVRLLVACHDTILRNATREQQNDECHKQLAIQRDLEKRHIIERQKAADAERLRQQRQADEEARAREAADAEQVAKGLPPLTDEEWNEMNEELIIEGDGSDVEELLRDCFPPA